MSAYAGHPIMREEDPGWGFAAWRASRSKPAVVRAVLPDFKVALRHHKPGKWIRKRAVKAPCPGDTQKEVQGGFDSMLDGLSEKVMFALIRRGLRLYDLLLVLQNTEE